MQRTLWLVYERPPHPDAVAYPANAEELELVLTVMKLPHRDRCHLSGLLRNWLAEVKDEDPIDRPGVAVRFGAGLYQPVPWRLAKWLSCILPINESGAESTRGQIRAWLENETLSQSLS